MKRQHINDLIAFIEVARERSFTKAAAKLGVSQSALSHTIRQLEERLELRLLTRTTRSVSPTDAGELLLSRIAPHFDGIAMELDAVSALRDKPSGNIRITTANYQMREYLWPKLRDFLKEYPAITVELNVDYGLQDIVAEGYDAGVRMGEQVAKDMIAVRISPDIRFLVVGAPAYFENRAAPETPRDLTNHSCINLRLPTYGGLYAWELEEDGREISVRVEGQAVFNDIYDVLQAAVDGIGLAHLPEDLARPYLESGQLVCVLENCSAYWTGFHLYYPSRRHHSPAFAALVKAMRFSG
ncbi:LysR family transcriptional regulator [Paenirhodobacter sp.]|uniref:LysR family transcriptional regulator n=1 Tax=Paenirhodobacter sp. TaxID=1965326 RepID=UPI003B40ACCB